MDNIPIIKVELEGMKDAISHAMMSRSEEFNKMINTALDKTMKVEVLQHKIDMQVAKALDNAIDSLSDSHKVKAVVMDIVLASLTNKRDEKEMERLKNS